MKRTYSYYCLKRLVDFEPETKELFCSDCINGGLSGYVSPGICQVKNLEIIFNDTRSGE